MIFNSILFPMGADGIGNQTHDQPEFFVDLNLDQIVTAITAGKEYYRLTSFFYFSLHHVDDILYRQTIMQDLENEYLFSCIQTFSQKMNTMREHLTQAQKLHHIYQKMRWFLDGVDVYCEAINSLALKLNEVDLKSRGFLDFREYVTHYLHSDRFTSLLSTTETLQADLSSVTYCLFIKGNRVNVRRFEGETDYSAAVEQTFEKFRQDSAKDYQLQLDDWPEMNHVEAQVLDRVAQLFSDVFLNLSHYYEKNVDFQDGKIATFDQEVQFYIAYLEYILVLKKAGLAFCYPQILTETKDSTSVEGFDLALAHKLISERANVVCNDFYLEGQERIFVVTGPNQGGKTTFARTFGQLHYLASLGYPVPGMQAKLLLVDHIFTHFEKKENSTSLNGKLQDDLVRMHAILRQATSESLIIMNEVFSSTTLQDALLMSKQVMKTIIEMDALCVFVTFIDELAAYSASTVSVVSTIVPDDPSVRTYKIVRKQADGRSYAISIAKKYRLTYDDLKERIKG